MTVGVIMPQTITDRTIEALLSEPKRVRDDYHCLLGNLKQVSPNKLQLTVPVESQHHRFELYIRQHPLRPKNFSIGLKYKQTSIDRVLVRLNGWHQRHVNHLEKTSIPENTCHIHYLTERYQVAYGEIDKECEYAERTDSYTDIVGALAVMVYNFGIVSAKTGLPFDEYPLFREDLRP